MRAFMYTNFVLQSQTEKILYGITEQWNTQFKYRMMFR